VCCVDVCVKESSYERESGERKVSFWSVGQLVERCSSLWVFFFGSFCPKSFFLLISCFFARRLCLFRKFDVFVLVVARRVEKKPGG
jgi:hypothetical protein